MASATRPFSRFEWMIAGRYLRPTRKEGFVSIISILSLLGIAVGVAALIIVMAVMNGFRHDLLERILGLRGPHHGAGLRRRAAGFRCGGGACARRSRRDARGADCRRPGDGDVEWRLAAAC